MEHFIGDLLFGGFVIIMLVILINDQQGAVALTQGLSGAYVQSVQGLASIR